MESQNQLWETHFPEFAKCADPPLRRIMDAATLVHFPAMQMLFYPGAACQNYLLVLRGTVHARMLTESGRELLLYQVCAGDCCILTTSCLLGNTTYPAEGITEDEVTAFAISKEDFFLALEGSKFFRHFVFSTFSNRLAKVIERMEELASGAIDRRLARALLSAEGILVNKTHQDLAVELGTAREVISRHLKQFEQNGWVRLGRGKLEITDRETLRSFIEDTKVQDA